MTILRCCCFFKQKTAYEIYQCDCSSDVCSSDLPDRLGEGVGLLEDHADALAQQVHVQARVEDAVALELDVALDAHVLDQVGEAVEAADERRLAAARGADEGGDAGRRDRERDLL